MTVLFNFPFSFLYYFSWINPTRRPPLSYSPCFISSHMSPFVPSIYLHTSNSFVCRQLGANGSPFSFFHFLNAKKNNHIFWHTPKICIGFDISPYVSYFAFSLANSFFVRFFTRFYVLHGYYYQKGRKKFELEQAMICY